MTVEEEYGLLVQSATLWRLGQELSRRQLGVHDIYHAFNGRRNGLMSCAELAAGLEWLGVPMQEGDIHGLVRGLDGDCDGLLSLEEWSDGLPGLPESVGETQEALANLDLAPKPIRELFEGTAQARPKSTPVPPMAR